MLRTKDTHPPSLKDSDLRRASSKRPVRILDADLHVSFLGFLIGRQLFKNGSGRRAERWVRTSTRAGGRSRLSG